MNIVHVLSYEFEVDMSLCIHGHTEYFSIFRNYTVIDAPSVIWLKSCHIKFYIRKYTSDTRLRAMLGGLNL